jgi:RNA recognition motif-containing protein
VGKHCGFVQFVRKGDAEKAIEKMQGFPIGGSRIRLSWGRSQCKLAFFLLDYSSKIKCR